MQCSQVFGSPTRRRYPANGDVEIARMVAKAAADSIGPDLFGPFNVVERELGLVIGGAGFLGPPDDQGAVEIGYGTAPEWRNRGLATEAVVGLLAFAWSQPSVQTCVCDDRSTQRCVGSGVREGQNVFAFGLTTKLVYHESGRPYHCSGTNATRQLRS